MVPSTGFLRCKGRECFSELSLFQVGLLAHGKHGISGKRPLEDALVSQGKMKDSGFIG
jgi:hypothetical protein